MKKGFTIIELIVTLVIIAIIGGIGIISYNYIFSSASNNYYKTLENSLLLAGNEYFEKNREEKPIKGYSVVSMDNLIDGNYLSPLKDKQGGTCEKGDVYITRDSNTNQYGYEVCLKCLDYESEGKFCKGYVPGSINVNAYLESEFPDNFQDLMSQISSVFTEPKRYTILVFRSDIPDKYYEKIIRKKKKNNVYILNKKVSIFNTDNISILKPSN